MKKPLWTPSQARVERAVLTRFMQFAGARCGKHFAGYDELYRWSVEDIPAFWGALWDFFEIKHSKPYDCVVDDLSRFPGANWFPGAQLNYAENMLRFSDKKGPVLIFRGENQTRRQYDYAALRAQVVRLATALRREGVKPGDAVAGYLPNLPETVIAMLAASAIGAVWCSCATDIGPLAAIDRLGQVSPRVLVTADGYFYKGKRFDVLKNAAEIAAGIPSLQRVVVAHYAGEGAAVGVPNAVLWDEYLADEPAEFVFEQLPAGHPLVVMFSSGTTGKPKCMVQSAAGLLLNQLKELALQGDIDERSTLLYITSCSWMMWNWQAAALGTGATIVLYDGNPAYPDTGAIWRILDEEKVTAFGLSASYIHSLITQGFHPREAARLEPLETVLQTGSALSDEGFAYVYREVKEDVHLSSIAGGTDINGCFATGIPTLPVYSGELQRPGLGMKIECYDDEGHPVRDRQGELVCEKPAPPMPLYFWNDPDGKRYHDAYFDVYPGVWRHGDYVLFHSDTGGVTFYGRSDSVLKPSGVRIGTAEIYNQVAKVPGVIDSLAIGQNYHDDQRILLFVQLQEGMTLDEQKQKEIRDILRHEASPRHVPARMFQVADIPRTMNGKKVESAVTNMVNGRKITNRDALQNPDSLDLYEALLPELQK